ncbi:hypothetical protein BC936DRAFT_142086 [Jimgerdemannia flammicorona]|uniref:Uncharacterized protein n=2 Tax=Jimgerdemannia flammicorona TaxID=994334 RepID=A0A433QSB5_9FUNG|nr:hypothetical protein BC936DRAFT_142086 [Jimgerdemannia flammicorona]RUS32665.1 hypothetical protein BC938DRAFT_474676 [Jimgerdemannia flammicorona]
MSTDTALFRCPDCSASFTLKPSLNTHTRFHCPKRNPVCRLCRHRILRAEVEGHLQICPSHPSPCKRCGILVPEIVWPWHTMTCPAPLPDDLPCLTCFDSFKSPEILQRHVASKHPYIPELETTMPT